MVKHKILPIPDATVGELLGLAETIYTYGEEVKISSLADELRMEMNDLGDVVDMGELLGVWKVKKGTISLTIFGEVLSLGNIDDKKRVLREKLRKVEPFKSVITALKKSGNKMDEANLISLLKEKFIIEDVKRFHRLLLGWGNYTELFEYDADEHLFRLNPAFLK